MSNQTKNQTFRLVLVALMIALGIVLNRIIPTTPVFHITLDFLPMFIVGILFGPIWGAIAYGLVDLLANILMPYGAINPGITFSLMLLGLIYGFVFYKKDVSGHKLLYRSVVAALLTFLVKLFVTTFFLYQMYGGESYLAYVILRLPNCIPIAIANLVLIPLVYKMLVEKIRILSH